jgi:hypothetical protein
MNDCFGPRSRRKTNLVDVAQTADRFGCYVLSSAPKLPTVKMSTLKLSKQICRHYFSICTISFSRETFALFAKIGCSVLLSPKCRHSNCRNKYVDIISLLAPFLLLDKYLHCLQRSGATYLGTFFCRHPTYRPSKCRHSNCRNKYVDNLFSLPIPNRRKLLVK